MEHSVHDIDIELPGCPHVIVPPGLALDLNCCPRLVMLMGLVLEIKLEAGSIILSDLLIPHGGLTGPEVSGKVPHHLCHSDDVSVGTPFRIRHQAFVWTLTR